VTKREAPAVSAVEVRRRFGPLEALKGIDIVVECGTSVALFGSNGAGKTTLLRVLAGLLRPTSGTVELFGVPLPGSPQLRRRVGVVAHETFLYPDLSAAENLRYYARLYGVPDTDRPSELLADFGLAAVSQRPVRTYSRGMLQRLSLARAILHRPELLLLDEPFAGLDPAVSALVEQTLQALHADGATIVFSSHDLEGGLRIAQRAVIMYGGRIAWDSGTARPSFEEARDAYERASPRI
jgi:heme exporter protein A